MELSSLLHESLGELARGGVDRKHPFRFVTFCTVTPEGLPDSRMVVLRRFEQQELTLKVYTDIRSHKVAQLERQPTAVLLFWHPKKRWQFKVTADFGIQGSDKAGQLYRQLPEAGQASYNTLHAPGTPMSSLKEAHQMKEHFGSEDFALLAGKVKALEVLRLHSENHIRAKYTFEGNSEASSCWLVP